jgi:hypothetical protein
MGAFVEGVLHLRFQCILFKEIHVEHWVQAKERRNVELKRIIPPALVMVYGT